MSRSIHVSILLLATYGMSSPFAVRAEFPPMVGMSQYLNTTTAGGGFQPAPRSVVPNGCGSETSFFNSNRIPQSFGGADFSGPCNAHDVCYGTFGAKKSQCDFNFLHDLQQECFTGSRSVKHIPPCLGAANLYFSAVFFGGGPAYRQGQLEAVGTSPFQPSLFRPAPSLSDRFSLLPKEPSFAPLPFDNTTSFQLPSAFGN